MFSQTVMIVSAWINTLLLMGCVISAVGGFFYLARSPRFSVFQLRKQARRRGWKLLVMSVLLLSALGLMLAFGKQGLEYLISL